MRALPSAGASFRNTLLQTHGRGTFISYTLQAQPAYPALFYIFRTAQQWSPVVGAGAQARATVAPTCALVHPPQKQYAAVHNSLYPCALTSSSWPRASAHAASKWGQIHGGKRQTPSSPSPRFLKTVSSITTSPQYSRMRPWHKHRVFRESPKPPLGYTNSHDILFRVIPRYFPSLCERRMHPVSSSICLYDIP